jgi:hypothetical protein
MFDRLALHAGQQSKLDRLACQRERCGDYGLAGNYGRKGCEDDQYLRNQAIDGSRWSWRRKEPAPPGRSSSGESRHHGGPRSSKLLTQQQG